MKSFSFCLIGLLYFLAANAQEKFPQCTFAYFKNKKVSTSICFDKENRYGQAHAWNIKGELIYEQDLCRFAGSSSVSFTYHSNGGVKRAEWYSAPDGGIQWHRSIHTFSEDGTLLNKTESRHDDTPSRILMEKEPQKPDVKVDTIRQQEVRCAVIYASEFWYINNTRKKIKVKAVRLYNDSETYITLLLPGDTLKGGTLILAEQYDRPDKYFCFSASEQKKAKHTFRIEMTPSLTVIPREGLCKYYYSIR